VAYQPYWQVSWQRKLWRSPKVWSAGLVLVVIALGALFAPLWPHEPQAQNLFATLKPPGFVYEDAHYVLGTDQLGRDVVSRLLHGARVSLTVGLTAVGLASVLGTSLGIAAGYLRGWVDSLITALTETLLTLPFIIFAIAIIAALGSSLTVVILTLGLTSWVSFAKLTRARVIELRHEDYILASKALGSSETRIMTRHILPNVFPLVIVDASLQLGTLMLAEAGLGFLGLGIQPPTPTWGSMLAESQVFVQVAWWLPTFPGLLLLITVLAINNLGDSLRDALDPRD
jgi:peptide/nickel transport system permease protein